MSAAFSAQALQKAHLEELASRPNTTVLTPDHEFSHEPWSVERLRPILSALVERVVAFDDSVDDFTVRKRCLDCPDVLEFQRRHPKMYWMLTDRAVMRDERSRTVVLAMLDVRTKVEAGDVQGGHEADALATASVMKALGTNL